MVFNVRRPFHRSNTTEAISDEGSNPSNYDVKSSDELPSKSATTVLKVSGAEIESELNEFRQLHQWDPNLPESVTNQVDNALKSHDLEQEAALDHELNQENSIYPEGMLLLSLSKIRHPLSMVTTSTHYWNVILNFERILFYERPFLV